MNSDRYLINEYLNLSSLSSTKIKMDGETVKYRFYKKNSQSLITIPKPIAKSLNWEDKDDIHMVIKNVDDKVGLFLFKEE